MKIGIISEFNDNNVNYGNRLQAYALNNYLNNFDDVDAYSLIINSKSIKRTTFKGILKGIIKKILSIIIKDKTLNNIKLNDFNNFSYNNMKIKSGMNKFKIKNEKFNSLIVGSDVVWSQFNDGIDNYKFLNFSCKNVFKYSYAASFGNDFIPDENKKYLKKMLLKFDGISVREKSSINLLRKLGINNAVHSCDPTLLLSKDEWIRHEVKYNINEKYVFVYLLGKDKKQRDFISEFSKTNGLKIVNITNSDGITNSVDDNFGDYKLNDVTIQNWLYLIDNSEYIFTDSFHGIVFSTIFEKKFFALKRISSNNINNRIIDYLKTINQEDKNIDCNEQILCNDFTWDYNDINQRKNILIEDSKKYICKIISKEK